jgi:hypothetical protein
VADHTLVHLAKMCFNLRQHIVDASHRHDKRPIRKIANMLTVHCLGLNSWSAYPLWILARRQLWCKYDTELKLKSAASFWSSRSSNSMRHHAPTRIFHI